MGAWDTIPADFLQDLLKSMPERDLAVMEAVSHPGIRLCYSC
jgi:hypothetical protein